MLLPLFSPILLIIEEKLKVFSEAHYSLLQNFKFPDNGHASWNQLISPDRP